MKRRTLQVTSAERLDALVARELGLSEGQARALVAGGAVYVQGRRTSNPEAPLAPGQTVTAVLEEGGRQTQAASAPSPTLVVLFEDRALLAVDKPAGTAAQPTPGRVGESLLDLASAHLGRPAGLVHRLDKETSGVTVFGKTPEATSALAAAFREGTAKKRYLAITGPGLPERGTIDLPLSKDPSRPGRWRASAKANGVPALTHYVRLSSSPGFCVVELFPQTGRTHQLRAHLTALGTPILGDRLYGGAAQVGSESIGRCLLHAQRLELPHPTDGRPLVIEAPPPADLARFL